MDLIKCSSPKVSIGMPVYNGEKYINEALESLLLQTFDDFELIISDNASVDRTEQICRKYAQNDSRIKYIRQPNNVGALNNFKFVVDQSKGEYFSWLAHDDCLLNNFISICSDYLDNNPKYSLVTGDFLAVNANNVELMSKKLTKIRYDLPWEDRMYEFYRFPISNAFFCIYGLARKNMLLDVLNNQRYGPLLHGSELPILSRLAAKGEIASLPVVLRKYRYHEFSSFHLEAKRLEKKSFKNQLLKYYNLWWNRCDQIIVLYGSNFDFKLKTKTLLRILIFIMNNFLKKSIRKFFT